MVAVAEFKADIISRVARMRFPKSRINRAVLVKDLLAGRSLEDAYNDLEDDAASHAHGQATEAGASSRNGRVARQPVNSFAQKIWAIIRKAFRLRGP